MMIRQVLREPAVMTAMFVTFVATNTVATPFTPIDLGTPSNMYSIAVGISENGQIIGDRYPSSGMGGRYAFIWTEETGMVDIGTFGGVTSYAEQVNRHGQVVGRAQRVDGSWRGFSWTAEGGIIELGALGGGNYSGAYAVNDHGLVVGTAHFPNQTGHACYWTDQGVAVDLGTLGGHNSDGYVVNNNGQIGGRADLTNNVDFHAYSWTEEGGMIDLGTLGGYYSVASAINDSGQIAGNSYLADDQTSHAFFWTEEGGMIDLDTLGGNTSWAYDVNDKGIVVGSSRTAEGETHAFVWTAEDGMIDLGTLGGDTSGAIAVNHFSQVVGSSRTAENGTHAFVWTEQSGMIDLGALDLEGSHSFSTAVNDNGWIVGYNRVYNNTGGIDRFRALRWETTRAPVAEAVANPSVVDVGVTIGLDGSGSYDPDGEPITYQWKLLSFPEDSTAVIDDATSPYASMTPDEPGRYVVQLVVSDGMIYSDPGIVEIIALMTPDEAIEDIIDIEEIIIDIPLDAFKNAQMRKTFILKLEGIINLIEDGAYAEALLQLEEDILIKTDGCAFSSPPEPDANDWIITCSEQEVLYPLILDLIDALGDLL